MRYKKDEAKEFAFCQLKGIWAASSTPFLPDCSLNTRGLAQNIEHWISDLGIDGIFFTGKQGEYYALSIKERKKTFEIGVEACAGRAGTMISCSDQNIDTVVELAQHAQNIGADFVIVHAPTLHFVGDVDEIVYQYYKYISERINIGIAMWSHSDSGYIMTPELCARIADLENIVAIKYSVPMDLCTKLTRIAGDKILVSNPSEECWLDNIIELGWRLYFCSSLPYLMQTALDRRMRDYTDNAFAGDIKAARQIRDSLEPVRQALKTSRPGDKPHAQQKYWQELLGQVGGKVRRPMLQLTEAERQTIKNAFESCGLIRHTEDAAFGFRQQKPNSRPSSPK